MHISFLTLTGEDGWIAFVSYERHRSPQDLANLLYSEEYRARTLSSKAIIVRPPVDTPVPSIKEETKKLSSILERFQLLPIYILYSRKFKIKLSKNINSLAQGVAKIEERPAEFINFLRTKQMQQFIVDSSAILRTPTPNTYFRSPSQEYSHAFLRVGNIQRSRHVLDSIFFWTLPYLENIGAILTDSWSISSTTFNISRLLARYAEGSIEQVTQVVNNFHVNMLSTYYHGLREMDKETRESLSPLRYKNDKKILFVISAVKTARSLGNIKKAIKASGFREQVKFLSLYNLVDQIDVPCLCQLDEDFYRENNVSFDSLSTPPVDSKVVPIDEQSFFPIETRDDLIAIKKAGADISKDFFEAYGGKGVITLHRQAYFNNGTPLRHHGIYVDVSPLLGCERFLRKLEEQIGKISKLPACIIYPPHDQGDDFVRLIQGKLETKFGKPTQLFCFSELEVLPQSRQDEIVAFLKSCSTEDIVLVVDDVSITGGRLHSYQKYLLYHYRGKIRYLVGVARPESEAMWRRRKGILQIGDATLDFVEMLILPDWNHTTCPWCGEKDKLREVLDNPDYAGLPVVSQLEMRLNELNRTEKEGLSNNVFFKLGSLEKPAFKGESVFCTKTEITEADLAASIASTIQHLRNGLVTPKDNKKYSLSSQHPLYSIVDPSDFLNGDEKFFEPLIKACILRAAQHRELYATEDINRQHQKLFIHSFLRGVRLPEWDQTFFVYELYLAMKLGKIPKPDISEHLRHVLNNYFTTGKALVEN